MGSTMPHCQRPSNSGAFPTPNTYLRNLILGEVAGVEVGLSDGQTCLTELDSHANMIVLGKHCLILNDSGKTAHVNSFSPQTGSISSVPIVDGACAYDCPRTGKTYLLVMRNGLSIPQNENNLIPPFIMAEAGLDVNPVPKIHCKEPTVEDHSIYDAESGLRISLQLDGIFSKFPTRALSRKEMIDPDSLPIVFLSPDSPVWDPYDASYAQNEAAMTDHRGDIVQTIPTRHDLLGAADISALASERPSSPDNACTSNCHLQRLVVGGEEVFFVCCGARGGW